MDHVLNWLWQGSVVAIAAAGMLRVVEPSRARIRYAVLWVVLLTVLLLPIVPSAPAPLAAHEGFAAIPRDAVVEIPGGWWTSARVGISLWSIWFALFAWRVTRAAAGLRRARHDCRPLPPDVEARLVSWLTVRTTGRRTRLVVSDHVPSAAVLAGAAPLIALAPRLLDHLGDEELDRVVIHEWAHVQRRDDLAHLVQLAISACVGWHPAIMWCDRQLHLEREMACDQFTAALTGSTRAYAACLARLATLPARSLAQLPVVAAISASGVRRRIVRVLAFDTTAPGRGRVALTTMATVVLVAGSLGVGALHVVAAVPAAMRDGVLPSVTVRLAGETIVPTAADTNRRFADQIGGTSSPAPLESRRDGPREQTTAAPEPAATSDSGAAPGMPRTNGDPGSSTAGASATVVLESRPLGLVVSEGILPVVSTPAGTPASATARQQGPGQSVAPWTPAVDASLAVSRRSQDAAVATAGFFNRLGRRIGGSF